MIIYTSVENLVMEVGEESVAVLNTFLQVMTNSYGV